MTTPGQEPTQQPAEPLQDLQLSIRGARAQPGEQAGEMQVELDTTRGLIEAYLHPCEGKTGCAIFIGGAAGGIDGPANRVYTRLSRALVAGGVTSLRLKYRQAGEFEECVMDTLAACSFLKGIGGQRAVIVGHSFGGAVAIKAGELNELTTAVAAMSSQRYGTQTVEQLGKPLLLVHGSNDQILDRAASDDIFARAHEPKRLEILDGSGHGLAENAEDVYALLSAFIREHAGDLQADSEIEGGP
jgi:alpha/beta superfamily hydrolase